MKQRIPHITFLLVVALLLFKSSAAQQAMAGVDRNKILIGEQVKLLLTVENAASINSWFQLPDSTNHIEVVERKKIDTIRIGDIINYRQEILITSFDSGRWQVPALLLPGTNIATQAITIDVLPVDVSHMQDYHDIKEIITVTASTPWYIIAALMLALLIAIAAIYYFYKKKKQVVLPKPIAAGQTPLEWALHELQQLQQQQLYLHGKVKQHYSSLTQIARTFFHLQLHHPALHQTTDEWMLRLQPLQANHQAKNTFFQMLRLAEAVKFAKYQPPMQENEQSVPAVQHMIEEIVKQQALAAYQPKEAHAIPVA